MFFPKSYIFKENRAQKVKQIGNAVPVNLAKALYSAILESMQEVSGEGKEFKTLQLKSVLEDKVKKDILTDGPPGG